MALPEIDHHEIDQQGIDHAPLDRLDTLSPRARAARGRALLAIATVGALLALLFLGDALSGLVPAKPYRPPVVTAGSYMVTLHLTTTQPSANTPLPLQVQITDTAHAPITNATVTYQWIMTAMDMGTTTGQAKASTTGGVYTLQVVGIMRGYWQLTVRIHTTARPDGTAVFAIPLH